MKKTFIITLFLILILQNINSTNNDNSIIAGLKNNRYGILNYQFNRWDIGLKHSIFSGEFKYQYFQFNAGYTFALKKYASFHVTGHYGNTYTGDYYNTDVNISGIFYIKRLSLFFEFQPTYDSSFDYFTCYSIGTGYKITKEVDFKIRYDDIPEFREKEKRIKVGFCFYSGNLFVEPEFSIPLEDNKPRTRVLCSFKYRIKL